MADVKNYAEALYQSTSDTVKTWHELRQVTDVISGTPLLKQLLLDASVEPVATRTKTIDTLLKNWSPLIRKFIVVVLGEGALSTLPLITESYLQLMKNNGVHEVLIETAQPLSASQQKTLLAPLRLSGQTLVTQSIKSDLIGGARVVVDDVEHDFSLSGALENLKQQLVTN